jgi:hypothetical protein
MELELMRWIPSLIGLFIAGFNAAIFMIIKFNDLKHLETSVKELTKTLTETNEKLGCTAERIAKIEGKCLANHG